MLVAVFCVALALGIAICAARPYLRGEGEHHD